MKSIRVHLPVLKGRISFVVDKGRQWSLLEHLLLETLAKRSWSTDGLAQYGGLPRRVVIEALVRLMRAGWVELIAEASGVNFRATEIGRIAVSHSELPKISDRQKRPTNYILDMVCGEIFRNRDLIAQSEQDIRRALEGQSSVWVEPVSWHSQVDVNEALHVLLDPDETFVSGQSGGIYRRWATVVVREGRIISGLPEARSLENLRQVVLTAAKEAESGSDVSVGASNVLVADTHEPALAVEHSINFGLQDLVLGGSAHKEKLEWIFESARTSIFIHSTFISSSRVLDLLPMLKKAAARGVYIHVFWGQNDDSDEQASTKIAIAELRKNAEILALAEHLVFYPFSTESHAKLLLADAGPDGRFVAVVGSCNWLTSGFASYEVSVVLRDANMVRDVVRCLGRLVCMHDGLWSELAGEIALISQSLQREGEARPTGVGSIVVGAQHNALVLRARDEAKAFILLASHRLGSAAGPGILAPLQSAAKNPQLAVEVVYCRRTSPVRAGDERRLTETATLSGVTLKPIQSPRIHAKLLVWDDDNIVVTSLNWLSADQTQSVRMGEIGVHLRTPGVGRYVADHLREEISSAAVGIA